MKNNNQVSLQTVLRGAAKLLGVFALLVIILFIAILITIALPVDYYETTDILDYGQYIGNNDNYFPNEFITSFFPREISEEFSNVSYSYRAENKDTYGFEAYLEFTISDPDLFEQHIADICKPHEWQPFIFDNLYYEYTIADDFLLSFFGDSDIQESDGDYSIGYAKIGKVLYSPSEQRIIYVAIGVFDGGIARTSFLEVFFNRFDIDPLEYDKVTSKAEESNCFITEYCEPCGSDR